MDDRPHRLEKRQFFCLAAGVFLLLIPLALFSFYQSWTHKPESACTAVQTDSVCLFSEPVVELPAETPIALSSLLEDPSREEIVFFADESAVSEETLCFAAGGSHILRAVSPEGEDTCTVTVYTAAETVSFAERELQMCVGESYAFSFSVPGGSEYRDARLYSSDPEVLSLEGSCAEARGEGTAVVTVILETGVNAACRVTVQPAPEEVSFGVGALTVLVGESVRLNAVIPSGTGVLPEQYSVSDPEVLRKETDGTWTALAPGSAEVAVETYNGKTDRCTVTVKEAASAARIEEFEGLLQYPELPTGCEVVSLAAVLRYYGFDIDKTVLADEYMPQSYTPTTDIRKEFFGDPHSLEGAGCYAPCIEITANRYFEENGYDFWQAQALTGESPETLYRLIQKGFPVIVWVTTAWKTPYVNGEWYTEEGDLVTWMFPEHCLVLVGYDLEAGLVTVSDVEYGSDITVSMEQFEYIYECMGEQAVILRQGY